MRQDARSLLEKLQQTEFAYRDFDEQEDEGDPWPLLEALLRHPALARTPAVRSWPEGGVEEVPPSEPRPVSRLFRRYDPHPVGRPESELPREADQPSLRSFLNKLGEDD